jgi:hypothetical protein
MKSTVLWASTPCSSEKARLFGGTQRLQLQGRIASQEKPAEAGGNQILY